MQVKLIGALHGYPYWRALLEKTEGFKGTRRLGVELAPSHLREFRDTLLREVVQRVRKRREREGKPWFRLPRIRYSEHPMGPSTRGFWVEVVRFADKKGIELVPLMSEHVYHAVGRTARPSLLGDIVTGRVKYVIQEKCISRRTKRYRVDTVLMGNDHVPGVKARLHGLGINSKIIYRPKFEPRVSLEAKEARIAEHRRRKGAQEKRHALR